MTDERNPQPDTGIDDSLYSGLQELAANAFPKRCAICGRTYASVDDYIGQTGRVGSGRSGLKQTLDDDGEVIVELFRNCVCGSTLMDCFNNRRDRSAAGLKQRERFGQLIESLVERGLEYNKARTELLKVMRGEHSTILRPVPRKTG